MRKQTFNVWEMLSNFKFSFYWLDVLHAGNKKDNHQNKNQQVD
jgi:hypothetical protein